MKLKITEFFQFVKKKVCMCALTVLVSKNVTKVADTKQIQTMKAVQKTAVTLENS